MEFLFLVLWSAFLALQPCLLPLNSEWSPTPTQEISLSTGWPPKHQVNIDCAPHALPANWITPSLDLGLQMVYFFFFPTGTNVFSLYFLFMSQSD